MTWDNFSRDTIQWRLRLAQGEPPTHKLARLTAAILAEPARPAPAGLMGLVAAPPEPPELITCTCPHPPCLWFTPLDDLPF